MPIVNETDMEWPRMVLLDELSFLKRTTSPPSHYSDSEIRMDALALHDDFSEQNRSGDDSGTIISDT